MSAFPTNKTVPLDKDIGVSEAKTQSINTPAREQLSVVLDALDTAVKTETTNRIGADAAEASARTAADNNLQSQINTEIANRIAGDNAEAAARIAGDNAEAVSRQTADTNLQTQIDGERSPLRLTVPSTPNKTVLVDGALKTRYSSTLAQSNLLVPNGSLVSDFQGAVIDFQNGTITYPNQSGPIVQQNIVDADILTSWNNANPLGQQRYGFWFVASSTGQMGSVDFRLGASGTISAQAQAFVYSDNAGIPGTQIGSSSVQSVTLTTTKMTFNFPFTSSVNFNAGLKYYVVVTIGHSNGFNSAYIWGDQATPGDSGPNSSYVFTTDGGSSWNVGASVANGIDPYFVLNSASIGGPSGGTFSRVSFAGFASGFAKYVVVLLPTIPNSILVLAGSPATTSAGAQFPAFSGGIAVGAVEVQDNGSGGTGTINNIVLSKLYQFPSAGTGEGGAGSGSPLDPTDSTFLYYTRSDFAIEKKKFFGSTTGQDQILGLKKVILNATQNFISTDLIGPQVKADAPIINNLQAKLLYNFGQVDESPTVEFSRDGGTTWQAGTVSLPGSSSATDFSGLLVIADKSYASSSAPVWDGGTSNDSDAIAATRSAAIINLTYRTVLSGFSLRIRTLSTLGSITAKIMSVTSGVPVTTLRTSAETYTAGQDVPTTYVDKLFTFKPITLEANTNYALVVEGTGLNNSMHSAGVVTGIPSFNVSSALWNGSSWLSATNRLAFKIYGAGLDLRLRITSSTAGSELAGFGIDFVSDTAQLVGGSASYEERFITSTEASSGLVNLTSVRYTPQARQLQVIHSGHVYTAPDFIELGPNQVQFPAGFFQPGDFVRFRNSYGLVDGFSASLAKHAALYDAVVGSAAQVSSGVATHSTFSSALSGIPSGGRILVLRGTYTESVTIAQNCVIEGQGYGSVVNGTFSLNAGSDFSTIRGLKFGGDLTLNCSGSFVRDCFKSSASLIVDNGTSNSKLVISE